MIITTGRLLTGDDDRPVDDAAILVRGEEIVAVGPRADVLPHAAPAEEHLDLPDATALPGLINAHVHLCFGSSDDVATLADADPDALLPAMRDRARRLLRDGVTTVRDLGDRHQAVLRLREAPDEGPLPRLLAAGAPLTPPGGHCWFLGGEVDDDHDALAARVDALADAGADWIKVMVSGGRITSGGAEMWESQYDRGRLDVIVAAATRRGLPVAAHAHGIDAVADAAAAGVATLEHCTMIGPQLDVRYDEAVVASMREHGTAVCFGDSHDLAQFTAQAGPDVAARVIGRLRWLADHGVTVIAGTDAGVMTTFDGTAAALANLGDDFSPAEILRMATVDAARVLRIGDHVGRLAPGYGADVLIVDGDPLTDLSALQKVRQVVVRGAPVPAV